MLETLLAWLPIWIFAMLFGISGAAKFMGLKYRAKSTSSRPDDPDDARVVGALQMIVAFLLVIASTRFWGLALAEFVIFYEITMLLYRSKYVHALAAIPLLALLPVAFVV